MRTLRSRHARNRLYIMADGKCQICKEQLGDDWQVDHKIPYWFCKKTELANLQAVCKHCNLIKGGKMLRKHQVQLGQLLDQRINDYKATGILNDKLVIEVFPGGGKSTHPIIATKKLKDAGIIDKVCWVVPRASLKNQGAEEFIKPYFKTDFPHNLEIRETENTNDNNPTRGSDGYITTYQALVSAYSNNKLDENCHQYEFRKHKYLIILDECQHICKDKYLDKTGYSYYQAVRSLFEKAKFKICNSGTLFRHEQEKIAFIEYDEVKENGKISYEPQVDIKYTYNDAIEDKAIIPVYFTEGKPAKIAYTKNGQDVHKSVFETNTDLAVALDSEYAMQLLDEGTRTWQDDKQRVNQRSKLIIIGADQKSCRQYNEFLTKKGLLTCLAISDEGQQAQQNVKNFRTDSKCNVLITCQMAYEGLDCKEATHLIVLTKIRSIPWLIQMFTRVMRYDKDNTLPWDKQYAVAFIPNDPAMKEALKHINALERPILKEEEEDILDLIEMSKEPCDYPISVIENKSSKLGEIWQSDLHGEELNSSLRAKIHVVQSRYNLHGPEINFYKMLRDQGMLAVLENVVSLESVGSANQSLTLREREKKLRDDIENLTRKLDYRFGEDYGTWNKKTFNAFRKKGRKEMTVEELQQVLQWVKEEAKREAKKRGLIKK